MSDPGRAVSVPPHTDRQDVLVLQTSGRKRWTVYAPTPVGEADPLRRGKDGDAICRDSLGGPLLDVTLLPGDLLYVPLGFPHETSTVCTASCGRSREDGPAALDPSVHITVNVDSLIPIWGLSYRLLWAAAQRGARLHAGLADAPEEAASTAGMSWERYSALQSPLPLGFLEGAVSAPAAADARELRRRAATWRGLPSDAEEFSAVADDHVAAAAGMLLRHREAVLRLHRQMYLDVLLGLSSAPPLEREMGHWALLQEQMAALRSEMGWG
ncbi:unnamed protein product [Prorocentrum cordatum]|uniref:Bifunctional lysine-specific demethylase and histidyl-hydroxylase n=1 Tax=Prorocentrum cordatum TaxID=2364126 RepID=A0ABN9QNU5_9DINO|nr:unnamed protein product [Polarella glacialis]